MQDVLNYFLIGVLIVHALLIIITFVRAIKGPYISDRIVAINMIGTLTMIIISVLTVVLDESWLADVAIVYSIISFIAVVVVTKIYIGTYREEQSNKAEQEAAAMRAKEEAVRRRKRGKNG